MPNQVNINGVLYDVVLVADPITGLPVAAQAPAPSVDAAILSNVAASATSVTIAAANAARKRIVIVNDSGTATLYLKFGTTASVTSYTYQLTPGQTFESPVQPVYTGRIDGIWSTASGAARVTEF